MSRESGTKCSSARAHRNSHGAEIEADRSVRFRLWAPAHEQIELLYESSRVFQRFQKVENIGRTAAGDRRHRIQVAFAFAPQCAADGFQHRRGTRAPLDIDPATATLDSAAED